MTRPLHILCAAGLVLALAACGPGDEREDPFGETAEAPASDAVGQPRPALTLDDLGGRSHHLDEWNGQVVLVNFWATWCPPCQDEMPLLDRLHARYEDEGFAVVGIAIDRRDRVEQFVEAHGIGFPVLLGDAEAARSSADFGNAFGALPFSAVIDREGIIRFTWMGQLQEAEAVAAIEPLL